MFTWICPVCGAEVPPSEAECPRCVERRQAASAAQPAAPPPAPHTPSAPPPYVPPQQAGPGGWTQAPPQAAWPPAEAAPQAPPQPAWTPPAAVPPAAAPPQQQVYVIGETRSRRPMPAWLAAVLTLAVIGGGLFLLYRYISSDQGRAGTAKKAAPFETPQAQASAHPFAKYLEVTGVRLLEGKDKKLLTRFVLVNHAPADLTGFRVKVTLEAANAEPGEAVIAVVEATPGSIPAYGVKDMEAPLVTPLRVYELPDWQFVRARVEIMDAK